MADSKISELAALTDIAPTDEFVVVDKSDTSMAASGTDKRTTIESFTRIPLYAPQGFLINGKISVTDAAGITVAIKTLAGTDPSASDPVYVRIGDTVRTISAALSVSKADGTNWMNAGSAELATKEIDYFVYLGYNATDGVTIGFSRIPGANQYSDFSATTTNEKYCAISTITTAAATDYYEVIGRFAATLSAGAGYTWSVPTYTAKNLIQRPIYETRWLTWVPVFTGFSSAPTGFTALYRIQFNTVHIHYTDSGPGTSNATTLTITFPTIVAAQNSLAIINTTDNSANNSTVGHLQSAGTATVTAYKTFFQGVWTNTGTKNINGIKTFYEI